MARANGLKQAVGKAMTIETSLRFATGAKLTQYAMALYNEIASRR